MKVRNIICWIIVLVILDQTVKLFIYHNYLDLRFDIIPSILEFRPTFNTKHSYVNSLLYNNFGFDAGFWPHIILFIIIEIVFLFLYLYLRNNTQKNRLLDIAFIFQTAGILCAYAGNILWREGTLDFIFLKPLFVFDLKDLYLNCFLVLFLMFYLKNQKRLNEVKIKDWVRSRKHR